MQLLKYENIKIHVWKQTNIHVEKYKYEKQQRVCRESKYIYIYNYTVMSNRNVNKETNKQNKMYVEKYLCENIKRVYRKQKV